MRTGLFLRKLTVIAVGALLAALSQTGWAINNPVGSGRTPPSTFRSGLIRSPNPIDNTANLVVTGNIGGGKHFRGVVPYNAVSNFQGTLTSTALDSFLRRSAGSESFGLYTGKSVPYYSQTGTVTTTRLGRRAVLRPPTASIKGDTLKELALPALPRKKTSLGPAAISPFGFRYSQMQDKTFRQLARPMSASPEQMEKVIAEELGRYSQDKKLAYEQSRQQAQKTAEAAKDKDSILQDKTKYDLKQRGEKAVELKRTLISRDKPLRQPAAKKPAKTVKGLDVYEQMKQQIDDIRQHYGQSQTAKSPEEAAAVYTQPSEKKPGFTRFQTPKKGAFETPGKKRTLESSQEQPSQPQKLYETVLSIARAKAILGEHKTFASFSEDKFNQHLRAGEEYLKQGKYYRAADAYTLASLYKPSDPLAYAGRSHALFAAGEYMSSALFLSRALEIFPEYAWLKINIEAMVGDRDTLETRIADVEKWLKINDAAELQFLLGYVYYQMGRPDRAKTAIDAAYEKMPTSPAVITLKKAIDEVANSR